MLGSRNDMQSVKMQVNKGTRQEISVWKTWRSRNMCLTIQKLGVLVRRLLRQADRLILPAAFTLIARISGLQCAAQKTVKLWWINALNVSLIFTMASYIGEFEKALHFACLEAMKILIVERLQVFNSHECIWQPCSFHRTSASYVNRTNPQNRRFHHESHPRTCMMYPLGHA